MEGSWMIYCMQYIVAANQGYILAVNNILD